MTSSRRLKKAASCDWHPADIKAALEKAGWSLRRLSLHHGYSHGTVRQAISKPYPNGERIIADAIGVEPWEIWPSRYDDRHFPKTRRRHAAVTQEAKRDRRWRTAVFG